MKATSPFTDDDWDDIYVNIPNLEDFKGPKQLKQVSLIVLLTLQSIVNCFIGSSNGGTQSRF